MKLSCEVKPGERVEVWVNGRIVLELDTVGVIEGRDELAAEVSKARHLEGLARIVASLIKDLGRAESLPSLCTPPKDRRDALVRGLADGLIGRTVPHRYPGVPPVAPESGQPYELGYDIGEALARAVKGSGCGG